jgi:hypothetical protein
MHRPLVTGCLLLMLAGAAFTQPSAPPNSQPLAANVQPPAQAPAAQGSDAEAKANDAKPAAKADTGKTDANQVDRDKAETNKPDVNKAEADKTEAEKSAASKAEAKKAEKKESDRGPEYLAQCLKDWDRGTHMTRQEWARTCRRVVSNRVRFLREQGQ